MWVQNGPKSNFSEAAVAAIRHAAGDGALFVSAISVWEVGLLLARGRVQFPGYSGRDWVREALATPGLSIIDVDANIAFDSAHLPGAIHADPADRIIAATARHLGATLLTRDRKLIEYGRQGHLKVIAT